MNPTANRMILLNPGPATTTDTVKAAMTREDICPRETSFGDLMGEVADRLAGLVAPKGDHVAVLFGGSGTAGVEAAIASAVPENGRLLVIDNGAYGQRMAEIAQGYRMDHQVLDFGVGGWIDTAKVDEALSTGDFTHLAIVHHETTTGMLNPVEAVGAVCHNHGVELIVDAMSSYAGIPISMEALRADYLVSSSNKCIQGMAGLSFVIARRDRVETLKHVPGRSSYLSLGDQFRFFTKNNQMRFTPPVQVLYALHQAIFELEAEGGVEGRHRRYMACFDVLDAGMRDLGFERLLPEAHLSRILTAYLEPEDPKYDYERMHDLLWDRRFTIYPGKGATKATFRLANMGDITPDDMRRFVGAMSETLDEMGVRLG
ncbi:MAG: 2-aminoethylphosphonate--pyruvate transaminase [Myxococcales bacterium]|nr:2-aminoethylphosphonate--pyruvate transaminase [Myxococcales bacterium]